MIPGIEALEHDHAQPLDAVPASPLLDDGPTESTIEPAQSCESATPVQVPIFPANPTPPADDMLDSVSLQPPSMTHHQPAPFQHQPTPPTDATSSPTCQTYEGQPYSTDVSFQPLETIGYPDSSPTPSAYQGYAYTPSQAQYPTSGQPYIPASYLTPTELNLADGTYYPMEARELAPAPLSYSPVDMPYPASEVSLTKPPQGLTNPGEYPNANSGLGSESSPESESSRDYSTHQQIDVGGPSDSDHSLSRNSDGIVKSKAIPTAVSPYQVWRETTIDDLRNVSLDPPFSTLSMPTFLLHHFDSSQFSDCLLRVTFGSATFQPEEFQLHRLVVAQSPVLAVLLASSEADPLGTRQIHLEAQGSFITPAALRLALRTCYGQSAWEFVGLDSPATSSASQELEARSWMESALAFIAAGNALQLEDVVSRGTQIAGTIVSWDNIEMALGFATEGIVDHALETYPAEGLHEANESAVDGVASPSGALKQASSEPEPSMMSLKPYVHGVAAYRMKQLCLRFLSSSFHSGWNLTPSARPLTKLDRLPVKIESRPSSSNSRFSHIQFGSLPIPILEDPNSLGYRLSSIVLSLPHSILAELFEQLDQMLSAETITTVVSERERRRKVALRDASVSYEQRLASSEAWYPVGWQESVNTIDSDGLQQTTMARTWTGFRNPLDQKSLT